MNKILFFTLVTTCIITHIIRFIFEILKHKKILKPGKLSFVIVFTNMILLWMSWFVLCSLDIYKIDLANIFRYVAISITCAGVIIFLTGLITIKTLESYEGDLITKGIYSKIRHPMYLAFILWVISFPVIFGAYFSFILGFVFVANILFWRHLEEKELEERFSDYREYKKRTVF
jgi:protein-S-isoprenylcysteine O-methyltransferase Ste14